MKHTEYDLIGKQFGSLTIIGGQFFTRADTIRTWKWEYKCACGTQGYTTTRNLIAGYSKSCGCQRFKTKPYESLYKRLKRSALRRKLEFEISFEQFKEFINKNKICHYCNSLLEWNERLGPKRQFSYNIDRKDVHHGYILDNCVPCCVRCNIGKSYYWTYEEWYVMTEPFRTGRLVKKPVVVDRKYVSKVYQ